MKLPKYAENIIECFLQPLNLDTPREVLLLLLNIECSRILCYNRIKIVKENTDLDIFPNLYSIIFMPSGSGKDRINYHLKLLSYDILEEYKQIENIYIDKKNTFFEERADNFKKEKKWTASRASAYLEENSARSMINLIREATPEGLHSARIELQNAGLGSIHFFNSEFADFIKDKNNGARFNFISLIKDLYEKGDSDDKSIKGSKISVSVNNIPQTMAVHSSLSGLYKDESATEILKDFFDRGFARRAFIFFAQKREEYKEITVEESIKKESLAFSKIDEFKMLFNTIHECSFPFFNKINTSALTYEEIAYQTLDSIEYKKIQISDEVFNEFMKYKMALSKGKAKFRPDEDDAIVSEYSDRHRRTLRLAGIIAVFSHPEDFTIALEDFNLAKDQVIYFAKHFKTLYRRESVLDSTKIYNFILDQQDKRKISKTVIKQQGFAPSNKAQFSNWFRDNLPELYDLADTDNKKLIEYKYGYSGHYYRIEDLTKDLPKDLKAIFSLSPNTDVKKQDNYKPIQVPFERLHAYFIKTNYAPGIFFKQYRKGVNWRPKGNLLIFDIDNDKGSILSIDDVKQKIDKFVSMLITTKSHAKKHPKYRIVLLASEINPVFCGYRNVIERILKHFNLDDYADIPASGDKARFYFPSPKDAFYWYSNSKILFNWKIFDSPVEVKKIQASKFINTSIKILDNELPGSYIFETVNGNKTFDSFEYLKTDETAPVRCLNPNAHKNNDKNPSAFIGRHKSIGEKTTNNKLMFVCSSCGVNKFIFKQ